jgi:probable HAF family extracellular repeat protein
VKTVLFNVMALVCMLSFGLISPMLAVTFTYSDIQVPGSLGTTPTGINNKGVVVGNYQNSSGVYGFVLSNEDYTTISCPDATQGTYATGINDNGIVVGYYSTTYKNYGFVYENGECKTLADFNGSTPYALAINNANEIVGYYFVANNFTHGFELKEGKYTDISVPNSNTTGAVGINANGDISGYYETSAGSYGFLLHDGSYQTINYPAAVGKTGCTGLNEQDFVVGSYLNPTTQVYNGFLTRNGQFMQMMVPGSVTTFPESINNSDVVVGQYFNGTVYPQGFMATLTKE